MNGFANHGLDEGNFGETKGFSVRTFDAFPKTKPTYLTRTRAGGLWTVLLTLICTFLSITESLRWYRGSTTQNFSVEKGVAHELQINIDVVVAMRCEDLHINIQDAAGDRILAAQALKRDATNWHQWEQGKEKHRLGEVGTGWEEVDQWREGEDVHDFLGKAGKRRKWAKTPKIKGYPYDACRIYGSIEGNKVQGDFHITARGHGYLEFGEHLDHHSFNFTHTVNELSFGPFYPSLTNPLDNTFAIAERNFYKFQYYLSVVPTIYEAGSDYVFTNQYAVTEQSHPVSEQAVPGIFFKYDIEPILLKIAEERGGFLALVVRLVNVVSGVLVAGGWLYQLTEWAGDIWRSRSGRRRTGSMGVLHGRNASGDDHRFN